MPRKAMQFANTKTSESDEYSPYKKYGIGKIYKCADCKKDYINPDISEVRMVEKAKKLHVDINKSKIVCEFCYRENYC